MEENKKVVTVSEMLRETAGNTNTLMLRIAEHIDRLEEEIVKLSTRVQELEAANNATE